MCATISKGINSVETKGDVTISIIWLSRKNSQLEKEQKRLV